MELKKGGKTLVSMYNAIVCGWIFTLSWRVLPEKKAEAEKWVVMMNTNNFLQLDSIHTFFSLLIKQFRLSSLCSKPNKDKSRNRHEILWCVCYTSCILKQLSREKKVEVPAISFNYTFHDEFLRTLSFCDVKLKFFLLQVEQQNWIWSCCWWTLQRIQLPYRRQFIFPRLQRRGVVGGKMMNRNLINFAYMGKTTLTLTLLL